MLAGEVFGQTVVLADTNRIDRGSTEIANEYVNVHAQGLAQEKGTQLAEREYVKQFSGMRYATAEVWAYHADDVREIVEDPEVISSNAQIIQSTDNKEFSIRLPNTRYVATMAADLALADGDFRVTAFDEPCPVEVEVEVVVAGHLASGEDRLREKIYNTAPGQTFAESGVSAVVLSEAQVLGFVTGSAEAAWLAQGRTADQAAKKKQDLLQAGVALAYVPVKESPVGRVGKPLLDYVMKNIAAKSFPEDSEEKQAVVIAAASGDIEERFQQIIREQRRENLTWTKDEDPAAWLEQTTGKGQLKPGDERIFYTPDGKIKRKLGDRALQAYNDWLHDFPGGVGRIIGTEDFHSKVQLRDGRADGLEDYKIGVNQGVNPAPEVK